MTQQALTLGKPRLVAAQTTRTALKAVPSPRLAEWQHFGMRVIRELSGGHQSRTFLGEIDRRPVIVKLTNGRVVDQRTHDVQIKMMVNLSGAEPGVVGPIRHRGSYANQLGEWRAVVFPYINGSPPDLLNKGDVTLMGHRLATLHRATARLPPFDLATVAALRIPGADLPADAPFQLLHGDFSNANLLLGEDIVNVLDFDDCAYGPVEFELGNSLFMVLFDATLTGDMSVFEDFRRWFIDAYAAESSLQIDDQRLDEMIELRRRALRYWLDHLDQAPIGIRSSSAEWRVTLRRFAALS